MTSSRIFQDSFDRLHDMASELTGLSDFGPPEYQEGLRRLLASCDKDVEFTESGIDWYLGFLKGVLVRRLYTEESFKQHPEHDAVKIKRPLVIVGLPRTGTTALHTLLSIDKQFQGIEAWLTAAPMVRPPKETWKTNIHYQTYVKGKQKLHAVAPEMAAIHDTGPQDLEECILLTQQNFVSNYFSGPGATGYEAWWMGRSERSAYLRLAKILQLIGLNDSRRWLLKCPNHLFDMESLFAIFPDACVVQTHRDPAKAIPSIASYTGILRQARFVGENYRPREIGPVEAIKWLHAAARADASREGREQQFCDVLQRDLITDPIAVVNKIYDHFSIDLTPEVEMQMRQWVDKQHTNTKPEHRYTAEEYGLSEETIRDLYATYMRTYGLA